MSVSTIPERKPELGKLEADIRELVCMSAILEDLVSDASRHEDDLNMTSVKAWRDKGYTVMILTSQQTENLLFATCKLGDMIRDIRANYYKILDGDTNGN